MKYKVKNYRYGLPVGSIISKEEFDGSKVRFLESIKEPREDVVTHSPLKKKLAKINEEI